jgi:hypothetical protein
MIVRFATVVLFAAPIPSIVALLSATPRILGTDDEAQSRPMTRQEFAKRLSKLHYRDSKEKVVLLLGKPDDIRYEPSTDPNAPYEVWCYGTEGRGSFAMLGGLHFRRGTVLWVAGGKGQPPPVSVISENELRAGMRILHAGPNSPFNHDPLRIIRVTNYLQPLRKSKALAIIGEYARVRDDDTDETWLFFLLRTLFDVPSPPGYMPDMHIGALDPSPPEDRTRAPRFPVVIIDDVPFSMLDGAMGAGTPQPVSEHVEYFQKHGTFRGSKLRPADDPYPSFKKLLKSAEWRVVHDPIYEEFYARRVLPQVLSLVRTAYTPPKPRDYVKLSDYDRYHDGFRATGARWNDELQMYVRADGTHGDF